jgi:hypothetical protein
MTKQELIEKIKLQFGDGTKFFRYLGYKNPGQSWYQFKTCNRVDLSMKKILEIHDEVNVLQESLSRKARNK